ncbi:MAG: hypothetical protein AAFN59_07145, partial [Pseudomonadota bacterium]
PLGERTLISKPGWLRGLHVIGDDLPRNARPRIEAFVPSAWAGGKICARMTTMVGTYDAGHEYDIPRDWTAERANLLYEGAQRRLVSSITPEEGGIAVERGPCFSDDTPSEQEFTANFWNDVSEPILNDNGLGELRLNMNIARADELSPTAVLGTSRDPLSVTCRRLETPDAIAFNYRCQILLTPKQIDAAATQSIIFSYTRIYRDRESAPRVARIFVGAGQ